MSQNAIKCQASNDMFLYYFKNVKASSNII